MTTPRNVADIMQTLLTSYRPRATFVMTGLTGRNMSTTYMEEARALATGRALRSTRTQGIQNITFKFDFELEADDTNYSRIQRAMLNHRRNF